MITFNLGVSFLTNRPDDSLGYIFATFARSLNEQRVVDTDVEKEELLKEIKPLTAADLLTRSFDQAFQQDVFLKSDIRPRRPVLCTFWIIRS